MTVTLYDRVSSAPLPEGSVRIAEHPAQRVTDLKDGRYTFKTLEKETLTIEAGCSGYEATISTLAVDPKVRKDYTLSITLQRVGKPEEILYPFLPPGTDIDARVNGELIFMNKLLEKYASDAHIIHEIKMRSENRMQLLRSGLEPGGYTLPEGVEP